MEATNVITKSHRLILRELKNNDFEFLFKLFNDPEVMKFYESLRNEAQTRSWMELTFENYRQYGYGKWIIQKADSGELIGHTGLLKIDVDGVEEIELGYFLAREFWGNGYATEAALAAKEVGFNKFNCKRIISAINPQNTPSIEVAIRLGMIKEKKGMAKAGETIWPCEVYSVSCF